MLLKRTSEIGKFFAIAVAMILAHLPAGFCQITSIQEDEPVSSETVEEIVVYGEKSLTHRRVCRANFVGKATSEEAKAWLLGLPNPIASATVKKKNERLLEEMEALAKE